MTNHAKHDMLRNVLVATRGSLGRALGLWLGSFVVVASLLIVYFRFPILPLLLAGGITLGITGCRCAWRSRKP